VENLIRTGMFGGKTDDTFGQGGFDLEDHLARLGRARKDALLNEDEFEEKIEREDNLAGQSFDERDKRDSRREEKVKANLKKRKVVDRLKESVPEELKDYFEDEADMLDDRPIAKRITRSQAKKNQPTLQEIQEQEQLVKRFAKAKKKKGKGKK
jgi:hypothetical protein